MPIPPPPSRRGERMAAFTVRVAGLWILAGALFKLFLGTPADLPQVVRDLSSDIGLVYKLAISAELVVAALALLRPSWAWLPLILVFLVFDAVLATQIAAGAENCGCFGSKVSVPPWLMLLVDSVLLLALILTRPWSRLGPGRIPVVALAGALAVGLALPWFLDREATPGGQGSLTVDGTEVDPALRQWALLDVESWVGQEVWDTALAERTDVAALPLDGLWVFYRNTCDHCAEHLEHLAATENGARMLALIRLKEPHDTEANRVVHVKPSGGHVHEVALPDSVDYVLTTPAEILVEGGKVVGAKEGVSPEEGL